MTRPRFIVGIDLGTTNSALAYVDAADAARPIVPFAIPQLVGEATVTERPALPSFLYVGGAHDVAPGALALPWDAARGYAVGEFARVQGARVPGRLISSAKSWLCHGGVDRDARILPWAAPDDVPKLSPVDASARYLQHLREAWGARFPGAPLEAQDVVLTVPASFDEVARELTVEAAARAGLERVVLLEEPQAAFYAWIHHHEGNWERDLEGVGLVLVIDIGGGTSDFSLVAVRREREHIGFERLAVGDHLLLGGDNIDLALARLVEPRFGTTLDSQRWHALANLCRAAKETLLAPEAPPAVPIRLVGRGRSVVGGSLGATLERHEVEQLVLDTFFPLTAADARPRTSPSAPSQAWGLPLATEIEVPRHLAAFLHRHAAGAGVAPDAILFNGGALKPPPVRERLQALLGEWSGRPPAVLASVDLDLAVARGAAYYGLVRRGRGVRIGGGSARAYYLGVGGTTAAAAETVEVLCIVPRGLHEGEEVEITDRELTVTANRPVSFPLYGSSTRLGDRAGALLAAAPATLSALPPIRTVLRYGKKLTETALPVHVVAKLTEVGTLEVWCRALRTDHRWRLQFALRDQLVAEREEAPEPQAVELAIAPERLAQAADAVRTVFAPVSRLPSPVPDPVALVRTLEDALGSGKDAWPLDTIRALWDVLWEGREARGESAPHEARWLNLCGFLLRPGFGRDTDAWRIEQLWRLLAAGPRFPKAVQCRVEWWNMWKRVAGGLTRLQQLELYNQVAPWLVPRLKAKRRDKTAVGPQEIREYWQLLGGCERLAAGTKAELGNLLVPPITRGKATDAEIWTLGRLGARVPFAGPLNCVTDRATVERWVAALLAAEWPRPEATMLALVQLARCTGDRERDLDAALRQQLAERLRTRPHGARAARLVTEAVPLERQERARMLDESLPVGLALKEMRTAECGVRNLGADS
jgi:molecular chaperone DnaK (HSP70)